MSPSAMLRRALSKDASFKVAGVPCIVATISTVKNKNPKQFVYLFLYCAIFLHSSLD